MRLLSALSFSALMLAALPAAAQVQSLDLSTVKCQDFLSAGKDNISVIATWLNAYYLGKDDPPVINFTKMGKDTTDLAKYCKDNPNLGLITAADKILGKGKE